MPEVNGEEPRPIKVIDQYNLAIESTLGFGKYTGGGFVTFEKVPVTMNFVSFKENCAKPRLKSS